MSIYPDGQRPHPRELVSKVHVNFPEVTNCKSGIVYFIFERKVAMAQSRKMIIFVS